MRLGLLTPVSAIAVLTLCLGVSSIPLTAQNGMPRTAWGQPDLGGLWDFSTITPLERPEELGDQAFLSEEEAASIEQEALDRNDRLDNRPSERATASNQVDVRDDGSWGFYNNFWLEQGTRPVDSRRTSLIVDPANGRIPPLTANGQRLVNAMQSYAEAHPADSWLDRSPSDRCLTGFNAGPPITPGFYNQHMQLFQTPDHVVIVTEMVHTSRVVPLDGRPSLPADIRQWSGDSRGYWEGDTLVVETSNFNAARGWLAVSFIRDATENMKLVERFTRVDENTLNYEFTVSDPDVWSNSFTAVVPMHLTEGPMYEYACHEGNHSMAGILAGQRVDDKANTTSP